MIGFWKTKRAGFLVSHQGGLQLQQVIFLRSLQIGDRLKMWVNAEEGKLSAKSADVTVQKMEVESNALSTAKNR